MRTGWPAEQFAASSLGDALASGATHVGEDTVALIAADGIDVIVEATGDPAAGIRHALLACAAARHIVMVNVEADALAGPLLARRAQAAGIVYSLAYGDQPALICEQVDWARAAAGSRSAMPNTCNPGVRRACARNIEPNLPAPIRPTRTGLPASARS